MNILISSGGTEERIDAVRSITNTSTGALGSFLADCFAAEAEVEQVFYIAGKRARLPQTPKAIIIPVTDTASLERAVRDLLAEQTVDAVAHCMAVSDFSVSKVTSLRRTADAMAEVSVTESADMMSEAAAASDAVSKTLMAQTLEAAAAFNTNEKISSNLSGDKLLLVLEETSKIIALFKQLSPKALLVGFKLLDGVPHETLIDTGYALLKQYGCEFVLANDAKDIHDATHLGYLIDAEKTIQHWTTKPAIAAGITAQVMRRLRASR
jgi:phosphopantothenate-cysteine ligase